MRCANHSSNSTSLWLYRGRPSISPGLFENGPRAVDRVRIPTASPRGSHARAIELDDQQRESLVQRSARGRSIAFREQCGTHVEVVTGESDAIGPKGATSRS